MTERIADWRALNAFKPMSKRREAGRSLAWKEKARRLSKKRERGLNTRLQVRPFGFMAQETLNKGLAKTLERWLSGR